jgi:hypothetical protein
MTLADSPKENIPYFDRVFAENLFLLQGKNVDRFVPTFSGTVFFGRGWWNS